MNHTLRTSTRYLLHGVVALFLCVALTACDDDDDPMTPVETETTITDLVVQRSSLSTLETAVGVAGLGDALSADGPLTVFAPSDDAFTSIFVEGLLSNPDFLAEVLQYHVVSGAVMTGDLTDGQTIETLQGDDLRVSITDGVVRINGATVTTPNVEADNGVVHIIDGLLLANRTIPQRLAVTASTRAITTSVAEAGLIPALNEAQNWTVFAPTDEAFSGVDTVNLPQDELAAILQYHIIASDAPIDAATLLDLLAQNNGELSVETLQGDPITFRQEADGGITINDGQASLILDRLDLYTDHYTNVIHLIDGVLLPDAPDAGGDADVTVTLDNVGSSAWEVTGVEGASDVAPAGTQNPALTLTVGTRYRFNNDGGNAHPLGFQDADGNYLLNQAGDGSLEDDDAINYEETSDSMTFTFTQELANAVATYRCTIHPSMIGDVNASS